MFNMYLYFVDDKNLVRCQCCNGGPEDRYGSRDDGKVDFKNSEDVYGRDMKRHVENRFGTGLVDRHGDHAADGYDDDTGVSLVQIPFVRTWFTYTQPKLNRLTKPTRLLPAILSVVTKGIGTSRTRISSKQLLTACPKNMWKKS